LHRVRLTHIKACVGLAHLLDDQAPTGRLTLHTLSTHSLLLGDAVAIQGEYLALGHLQPHDLAAVTGQVFNLAIELDLLADSGRDVVTLQVGVAAEGYAGVASLGARWGHEIVAMVAARGVVAACVGEVVDGFKLWWLVEARWVEGVGRVVVYGLLG